MAALVRGICGGSIVVDVVVVVLLDLLRLDDGYLLPRVRYARPTSGGAGSCDLALAFRDGVLMICLDLTLPIVRSASGLD